MRRIPAAHRALLSNPGRQPSEWCVASSTSDKCGERALKPAGAMSAGRAVLRAALAVMLLAGLGRPAVTQESGVEDQAQPAPSVTVDPTVTTLQGVVRNASTGEGIARALVEIEGDADTGALTDGEGRFEIPGVPLGPQQVDVLKPGYFERAAALPGVGGPGQAVLAVTGGAHNVMVAAGMPELVFMLAPTGAIRGQVELSTGDTAQGMTIELARRGIESGRAVWQEAGSAKTRSDGTFRFGGLADGDYAVWSDPAMDSDLDAAPSGGGLRWGYAAVYYPDARDPSGVAAIHVANGQDAQANLMLTLEAFQAVKAVVVAPQTASAGRAGMRVNGMVADGAGHLLAYPAQYDEAAHSVEAELPDGSYTLLVSSAPQVEHRENPSLFNAEALVGSLAVTVAGSAVTNLRVALAAPQPGPLEVTVMHNVAQPSQAAGRGPLVSVLLSPDEGWINDGMILNYADPTAADAMEPLFTRSGSYWVHTRSAHAGLCVSSFTAGGANLAREPLTIGLQGSTAPMELTLRDDCASLELSLPEALGSFTAGDEPFFSVYVVPDFDSTGDVDPVTLRPSTGGTVTVSNLTPGNYHVYTLAGSAQLAYRNRDALAAMGYQGQAVTLSAGTVGSLVVEAPEP